ncbi:MAG: hypothetical protein QM497_04780 [Sulfurimonas sp.]
MRDEAISIIIASQTIGLIRVMSKEEQKKGSVINFIQFLQKKIREVDYINRPKLAIVCRDSLLELVEIDEQCTGNKTIAVATILESLSYSFDKELRSVFGNEYFIKLDRFVTKQSYDGISDYAPYSYAMADSLRDSVRKYLFKAKRK